MSGVVTSKCAAFSTTRPGTRVPSLRTTTSAAARPAKRMRHEKARIFPYSQYPMSARELRQNADGIDAGRQFLAHAHAGFAGPEDALEDEAPAFAGPAAVAGRVDLVQLGGRAGLLALLAVDVAVLALFAGEELGVAAAAAGVAGDLG